MGVIALIFTLTWLGLAAKAWHSARKEYHLDAIQNRYQTDPFLFHTSEGDSDSSEGSDRSDVSERVLKTRASTRPSIYSLGSQSTLNLLQRHPQDNAHITTANRGSMFISPTEIIKNSANNKSLMSLATPTSENFNITPVLNTDLTSHFDPIYQKSLPANDPNNVNRKARPPSVHLEKMFDEDM